MKKYKLQSMGNVEIPLNSGVYCFYDNVSQEACIYTFSDSHEERCKTIAGTFSTAALNISVIHGKGLKIESKSTFDRTIGVRPIIKYSLGW